jgi:hypothetical protein
MIVADAHRRRGVAKVEDLDPTSNRAVAEYSRPLTSEVGGQATVDMREREGKSPP